MVSFSDQYYNISKQTSSVKFINQPMIDILSLSTNKLYRSLAHILASTRYARSAAFWLWHHNKRNNFQNQKSQFVRLESQQTQKLVPCGTGLSE